MSKVGRSARRNSQSRNYIASMALYNGRGVRLGLDKKTKKMIKQIEEAGGLFYKGEPRILIRKQKS
jgi:hypothetical protein